MPLLSPHNALVLLATVCKDALVLVGASGSAKIKVETWSRSRWWGQQVVPVVSVLTCQRMALLLYGTDLLLIPYLGL